MPELFTKIFTQYGPIALAAVIALVWIVAHFRAESGQEISVFFGLAKYTKGKSRRAEASRIRPEYPGRWYAAHFSREKDGTAAISHHEYVLEVTEAGDITGTMEDHLTDPPWKFALKGALSGDGLFLFLTSPSREGLVALQLHDKIQLDTGNVGLITNIDRKGEPFSTPIVFSRTKFSDSKEAVNQAMARGRGYLISN